MAKTVDGLRRVHLVPARVKQIVKKHPKSFIVGAAFLALFVSLAFVGLPGNTEAATPPNWNVAGNWKFDFAVDGGGYDANLYDVTFSQTDGTITGLGQYPDPGPAYAYAWSLAGTVAGDNIDFVATYTLGAVGTIMNMHGVIAADGTMSGTWDDNYGGGRTGTWYSTSGQAVALSAEDFGVVNYDTGLGILKGYTAGFGLTNATFAGATSVVVKLYAAGDVLLQTNTAILPKFNADVTGTQFSSPFDVSGTFNYASDGYWTNVREVQFGYSVPATKVVATVTLADGRVVTAENTNLTGDPATIMPDFGLSLDSNETAYNPVGTEHTVTATIDPALAGIPVLFDVTGMNPNAETVMTNGDGESVFSYIGNNSGKDTITVCIDLNNNDVCDGGEPSVVVTKYWLDKFVTGGGIIKETLSESVTRGKVVVLISSDVTKWTFGGNVGIADDETQIVGNFQINDHVNQVSCHFNEFGSLVFSNDGKTVTFDAHGTCNKDADIKDVIVEITDNGEPGVADTINVTGDLNFAGDPITGGNFQVRPPAEGASLVYPAVVTGQWLLSVNSGAYLHDMFIVTQAPDGTLTGTGGYPAGDGPTYPYPYNWTLTGQLTGSDISMTITYQNGYTATITGTVSPTLDFMSGGAGTGGVVNWSATLVP